MKTIWKNEERYIKEMMDSSAEWMNQNKPPVTYRSFMGLVAQALKDKKDMNLSAEWPQSLRKEWAEDPLRPLLIGQHTPNHVRVDGKEPSKNPRRSEREAFHSLYHVFPRMYGCLYEDFMGPKYQLAYDNIENRRINLDDGSRVPDPFPARNFSDNLKCLVNQNMWMGNLGILAICIQYVNILRTRDTRTWKVINYDDESRFFETWQTVVSQNIGGHKSIDDLFSLVKHQFSGQGFYCK
ncbi:uncharacterized protein F4822DRAFT_415396 [Hypoxylon trugodes]|uniref:uncharacterized protein n=1 Tax=Hypoxylon trugodes TaxID=326681 RepID=UPI002196345F|nr:uncharacterized protein F4822DRAFT_415396 [Hypoxylon trugodes]KAI1384509.1 hypothetical protein F4822DRAFT_415396 [Hypoxylon trugodes]